MGYADNQRTLVIHVPATFYRHPTRLVHPRITYWHNRGKEAEKVGLPAFEAYGYHTAACQTEANGQALIVIVPNMFYNQQMGVFHSEIIARVYITPDVNGALKKPLLIVKGQGESRGWVSYNSENFTNQSYQQAFDQVIQQIQESTAFQQTVGQLPMQNYKVLCDSVDTLSQQNLYF